MDPFGYLEEIIIVLALIGANGILSLLEMALVSSRKSRLEQLAATGNKKASYILQLADDPTDFFSTVQIGITLVGIGTGVYSGAALAAPLTEVLSYIPGLAASASVIAYTIVVALVTYLSIILGELTPKRIAISNPETMIVTCAPFVHFLVVTFKPLTLLLSVSTKIIVKFLKIRNNEEQPISEDEVRLLIEQGAASGVFNTEEQKIMINALELDDLRVSEIMTPRTQISWLDIKDSTAEHLATLTEKHYSAFVVAEESLDNVLGVVYTKRFLLDGLAQKDYDLAAHIRQPLYIPETMRIDNLLKQFQQQRVKIALVVDEFGSLAGMVTLRDVVEHIVGDVPSFDEDYEQKIVKRDEHSWLVDGMLPISDFADHFHVEEAEAQNVRQSYNTVAGLVVSLLGHIPQVSEKVDFLDLHLEVVDMDGNRVDKIMVSRK